MVWKNGNGLVWKMEIVWFGRMNMDWFVRIELVLLGRMKIDYFGRIEMVWFGRM